MSKLRYRREMLLGRVTTTTNGFLDRLVSRIEFPSGSSTRMFRRCVTLTTLQDNESESYCGQMQFPVGQVGEIGKISSVLKLHCAKLMACCMCSTAICNRLAVNIRLGPEYMSDVDVPPITCEELFILGLLYTSKPLKQSLLGTCAGSNCVVESTSLLSYAIICCVFGDIPIARIDTKASTAYSKNSTIRYIGIIEAIK